MQEIFLFYAESGLTLEYTLLAIVWVQCTLSVWSSDLRLRGGGCCRQYTIKILRVWMRFILCYVH